MLNSRLSLYKPSTFEWIDVGLTNEIPVTITYAVADIREPDKRNSANSKTVSIPGTREVNNLFELLFDVDIALQYFNPNLKTKAIYYINDEIAFTGNLQILDMDDNYNGSHNSVVYNCAIVGAANDLIVAMGDKYLSDIDFSGGFNIDHTFTIGANTTNQPATIGEGYCYPWAKYGIPADDDSSWTFENLKPWIFARYYFRKIFYDAGKTWTSNFINSTYFKHLIVSPGLEGTLQTDSVTQTNAQFLAGKSVDTTFTIVGSPAGATRNYAGNNYYLGVGVFDNDSTGGFFDPGAIYDNGTNISTKTFAGYYEHKAKIDYTVKINPPAGTVYYSIVNGSGGLPLRVDINNCGATSSGVVVPDLVGVSFSLTVSSPSFYHSVGATEIVQLLCGTEVLLIQFFDVSYAPILAGATSITVTQKSTSTFGGLLSSTDLQYGGTVLMNETIPKLIKQKDFFMGIVQMHNLYVMQDPDNENNFIIEPREDFIQAFTPLDWTYKLDISKPRKVIPMGDLDFKQIVYSYKTDKDYLNKKDEESHKITYSTKIVDVANDFIKNIKQVTSIFSATPVAGNFYNDLVYPKIYQADTDGSNPKSMIPNIRILYWKGATACNPFTRYTQGTAYTDYSYNFAGMMDDPYNPTVTLDWGEPLELYYDYPGQNYINNGLYNRYYSKMIQEITDKDSKIIRAYFNLTEIDISTFSFRKTVLVDGAYYYVNKIIDYNPNVKQTTLVELLKLKAGTVFTPGNLVVLGGNGVGGGNYGMAQGGAGNVNLGVGGFILGGNNNYIGNG